MLAKIHKRGGSFKGVTAYISHDKNHAKTSARVGWSITGNLTTDNINNAAGFMAFTALNSECLKREFGGSVAGRKSDHKPVLHTTLSWALSEKPSEEHMKKAAISFIKSQGLEEHQYFIVAHNDTAHNHVHVVSNLVHPVTGKTHSLSYSKREAQSWALGYEKEHGIHCKKRVENAKRREAGEKIKHQEQKQDYSAKVTDAFKTSDNGKSFINALRENGLELAKARRGNAFLIVDQAGDIQKLSRQLDIEQRGKHKSQAIEKKLADLDRAKIRDAEQLATQLRGLAELKEKQRLEVQEQEKRSNEILKDKTRAAKRENSPQVLREENPKMWDRDKANQDWKDSIAQAGIDAEKKGLQEEKSKGKGRGSSDGGFTPDQDNSYAAYLDKRRAYENKEDRQRERLEDTLSQAYSLEQTQSNLKEVQQRVTDSNSLWGRSTGKHQQALDDVEAYKKNLANINQRQAEARGTLEKRLDEQRPAEYQTQKPEALTPAPQRQHKNVKSEFERTGANDNLQDMIARAEQKAKEQAEKRKTAPDKGRDRGGYER